MKYYINYGPGAANQYVEGTLEDAMRIADQGAAYTQCDITIEHVHDDVFPRVPEDAFLFEEPIFCDIIPWSLVAIRQWFGEPYSPHKSRDAEEDILNFGDLGYYGAWDDSIYY